MTANEKRRLLQADINDFKLGKNPNLVESHGVQHLKETNKKLYQYRSLDSSYTWSNLINNEVFLSDPVTFNDPFDCNMGISESNLIKAFLPYEIVKSNNNIDLLSAKKIVNFFSLNPNKIVPNEDELMKNIKKIIPLTEVSENVLSKTIVDSIFNIPEILLTICSHATGYKISVEELSNSFIGKIINSMSSFLDDPLSIDEVNVSQSFLSLANFDTTNLDAFDVLRVTPEAKDALIGWNRIKSEITEKLHKSMGSMFGVSCFTENPDNILMWSHYSNKHTGICVEYDFSMLQEEIKAYILPVLYTNRRPSFPINRLIDFKGQAIGEKGMIKVLPNLLKAQLTKSVVWNYENEWRLLGLSPLNANHTIKLPVITKIITGVNISDNNMKAIEKIAEEKGIGIERCSMKSDQYALF